MSHLTFYTWRSIPKPEMKIVLLKHFPDFLLKKKKKIPIFTLRPDFISSPFLSNAVVYWPGEFRGRLRVVSILILHYPETRGIYLPSGKCMNTFRVYGDVSCHQIKWQKKPCSEGTLRTQKETLLSELSSPWSWVSRDWRAICMYNVTKMLFKKHVCYVCV